MACAIQRDEAQSASWPIATARSRAGALVSNSTKHSVIRLPHAADKAASTIADESQRRQRAASILRALVEREVVPRLLAGTPPSGASAPATSAAGEFAQSAPPSPPPEGLTSEHVLSLSDLLLAGAEADIAALVRGLRGSGISADALCLHLLTGAARHLGDLWVADRVSFADVTVATDELQRLFRELATDISPPVVTDTPVTGTALLTTVPGEQHSFGLSMLAAFFRRAGWTVATPQIRNAAALQRSVSANPVDLLGISLGAEIHLDQLTRCIERTRRSAKAGLIVMVGGPLFVEQPELARLVGADATAPDAVGALSVAERLLRARRARRPAFCRGSEPPA